jgi:NTP pyrophosphatase (non-canonical NTP hydrolase)
MNKYEFDVLHKIVSNMRGPKTNKVTVHNARKFLMGETTEITRPAQRFIDRLNSIKEKLAGTNGHTESLINMHVSLNGAASENLVAAAKDCISTGESPSRISLQHGIHSASLYSFVAAIKKLKLNYKDWELTQWQ